MTTGAGAGLLTRQLLDLDSELLAALLDVDRTDLPGEGFMALVVGAGAVAGSEGRPTRRQNFYVVGRWKGGTTGGVWAVDRIGGGYLGTNAANARV